MWHGRLARVPRYSAATWHARLAPNVAWATSPCAAVLPLNVARASRPCPAVLRLNVARASRPCPAVLRRNVAWATSPCAAVLPRHWPVLQPKSKNAAIFHAFGSEAHARRKLVEFRLHPPQSLPKYVKGINSPKSWRTQRARRRYRLDRPATTPPRRLDATVHVAARA